MQYTDAPFRNTAQAIADLLEDGTLLPHLHRIAERHMWLPKGSMQAREVVADVIAEMSGGEITRDARDLDEQLWIEVIRRAERWRREADRDLFVSLDDAPTSALVDDTAHPREGDVAAQACDHEEIVRTTRELAGDDPAVLQLLEMYELRVRRNPNARKLWMPPGVHRGALRRLKTYAATAKTVVLNREAQAGSQQSAVRAAAEDSGATDGDAAALGTRRFHNSESSDA